MTDFAYEIEIPVRYRDLDTYGHVNNANHATYLEEARIAYFEDVLGLEQEARGMLVVSLSIDFEAPIHADVVTVGLGITRIGDTSFDFEYVIEVEGSVVARAETVQVAYDEAAEETIPFPEDWRNAVREYEGPDAHIGAPRD